MWSTASFPSEEDYNAVSDSEESTESDDDDDDVFRPGDAIQVVAGKYAGRSGVVRKAPVKWVPVLIHGTSTQDSMETSLPPTSVRKVRNAERRTRHNEGDDEIRSTASRFTMSTAPSTPSLQHAPSFPSEEDDNAVSDSEESTESDDDDDDVFRPGDAIQVVAGKYAGRSGVVRKAPVKWVPVLIYGTSTQDSMETSLPPTSVRKVRNAERRTRRNEGDDEIRSTRSTSSAQRRNTGGPVMDQNIDGMNYEQPLEPFRERTENRGANEGDILSLPTSTITNASSLPNDHSDCMVCLESFQVGDERKILPCLHGFHSACVDRWLRINASCPVCKHSILPASIDG